MKQITTLCIFLVFAATNLFSQANLSIGINSGVLFSKFEKNILEISIEKNKIAIPVGGYFGMQVSENMEVGVEFSTLGLPFRRKVNEFDENVTISLKQTMFGGYTRIFFPSESVVPYIRAGAGYYTGSLEGSGGGNSFETNFKGGVGFNLGAGIGTASGLYLEFIYHIVTHKFDSNDFADTEFGYNSLGGQIGWSFAIN